MSDQYFATVVGLVERAGGTGAAVSRYRVEACEGGGVPAEHVAGYELELQAARAAVRREIAEWNRKHAN